ncbi:hypothetical protein [Enterovibrio norvegicus]|uniref:hypothetical protein n=1 Tax=Enterovibrio norvegicus TaxID=188144 RepID=UPI00352F5363
MSTLNANSTERTDFETIEEFEAYCQTVSEYFKSVNDQIVGSVSETVEKLKVAVDAGASELERMAIIAEGKQKEFQILADEAHAFAVSADNNEWINSRGINVCQNRMLIKLQVSDLCLFL